MRYLACAALAALALWQAPARAKESPLVTICKYVVDRSGELIRLGQVGRAREMRPQLVKCIPVLKAEQLRQAREIIRRYDDAVQASKGQPI
jgi:hypothetical protein